MKAFDIIALVEENLPSVQYRVESKGGKESVSLYPALSDEQMDCAFARIAEQLGTVSHTPTHTVIELI